MGCGKSRCKREVHSNKCLLQKTRKDSNSKTLHLRKLGKECPMKPKVSRRKEIKIREEINEIETKKIIERINESKSWLHEKINKINKT